MIKLKIMALLNRNCGNCNWCKGVYCKVPIKTFDAFKGLITLQEDNLFCVNNVARTNCKWKKKND